MVRIQSTRHFLHFLLLYYGLTTGGYRHVFGSFLLFSFLAQQYTLIDLLKSRLFQFQGPRSSLYLAASLKLTGLKSIRSFIPLPSANMTIPTILQLAILCFILCAINLSQLSRAEESVAPAAGLTIEEAGKINIKQLQKSLFDRGLECKGCAEKEDYVKMKRRRVG